MSQAPTCTRTITVALQTLSVVTVDGVASLNHGWGAKSTNFWQELWSGGEWESGCVELSAQCSVPMKWLVCAILWRRVGRSDEDGMVDGVLPCLTNALSGRTTLMDASNKITDQRCTPARKPVQLELGFRVRLVR